MTTRLVDRLRALAFHIRETHSADGQDARTAEEAADLIAALSTLTDEMVERGAKALRDIFPALSFEEQAFVCLTEAIRAAKGE